VSPNCISALPPASKMVLRVRGAAFGQLTLLALLLACILGGVARAQATGGDDSDQKVKKVFYSAKDRLDAMHAAALYQPKTVPEADVMQGPKQSKKQFQLHYNDKVICDFATPGMKMGGKTPKFACKITRIESTNGEVQTVTDGMDEEPVKVKFGADDNEVYAEIVATRLMWTLGYYADSWFPVRVECHGCPENPISGSGSTGTRMFDPATIVRKYPGHKMYENGKEEQR
jgi:hypothetical protein